MCDIPPATATAFTIPRVDTAEVTADEVDPLPNCPLSFSPQHFTAPVAAITAQLNIAPTPIALTPVTLDARTGVVELASEPRPSSPTVPSPQQYTAPDDVSAHVCSEPAATAM
jgi:hypothetical protein